MAQPQYSLSWDAYQSSICGGFSALQQNGEMVDMTLAADGHIVKVHQILMALASPFLKELISSAPCKHPVIFLNNVSHQTLCYLLEYVYTGEVLVPATHFPAFIKTAKELHIKGLEQVMSSETSTTIDLEQTAVSDTNSRQSMANLTSAPPVVKLPPTARKIHVKSESTGSILAASQDDYALGYSDSTPMDDSRNYSDDDDDKTALSRVSARKGVDYLDKEKSAAHSLQFTVSNRGSLQMILNRYLYNLVSTASRNGLRRWRCVDYRTARCQAFVVTKGNIVSSRSNLHNHQFHDKKILSKIERKSVYTAIDDIEASTSKDKNLSQAEKGDTDMVIEEVHSTRSMLEIPGVNKHV